jgi:hypothetical protein
MTASVFFYGVWFRKRISWRIFVTQYTYLFVLKLLHIISSRSCFAIISSSGIAAADHDLTIPVQLGMATHYWGF